MNVKQQAYVTDRMAKLMFVLATLAFLGVQSMAILIFIKRFELHFHHQLFLYVIAFGTPLPWLIGIQGYKYIKKRLVAVGDHHILSQTVLYFVMFVIGAAYLQLLFYLGFVVAELHLRI